MAKNKKKSKAKKAAKKAQPQAPVPLAPAEAALVRELEAGAGGTLSDRLNPGHPAFDAALKARWKGLGKKTRHQSRGTWNICGTGETTHRNGCHTSKG